MDNRLKRKTSDVGAFLYENEKGKIVPLDDVNVDIMRHMLNDPTV